MHHDCEQLLNLVQTIYQKPGDREQWDLVLGGLEKLFWLHNLTIVEVDLLSGVSKTTLHHNVLDKYVDLYQEIHGQTNIVLRDGHLPVRKGFVGIDHEIIGLDELRKAPLFCEFMQPQGIEHILASILDVTNVCGYMLSVHRNRKTGPFTQEDKQMLEAVGPHLANRIALETELELSEKAQGTLEATLALQSTACVLLGKHMQVIYANKAAEKVLKAGDGLALTRERRLTASQSHCAAALQQALENSRTIRSGSGFDNPGLVRIDRPSGKQPYTLLARPFPLDSLWSPYTDGILVIIKNPEMIQSNLADSLAKAFDLTTTETEVAILLLQGKNARQISASRHVSMPTVRSHIRNLLEKAGTNSQLELVSLVFRWF